MPRFAHSWKSDGRRPSVHGVVLPRQSVLHAPGDSCLLNENLLAVSGVQS
jgi:hypothetical protein